MNRTSSSLASARLLACALGVSLMLGACGGGDDDSADPAANQANQPNANLSCDTTAYVAGSVALPTGAELTALAGTYNGDEGNFGPNPGDPFVKSGTATFVLNANGTASYKGTALTVKSVCMDKVANGTGARFIYVLGDQWHVDVTDKGEAFGVAPPNGAVLFQNGKKS